MVETMTDGGQTVLEFTKVKPAAFGEYVLIRPLAGMKKSKGGIVIPETATPDEVRGVVLTVGRGRALLERDGQVTMVAPEARVGDVVIFRPMGGYRVLYNDVEHWVVPDSQVLLRIGVCDSLVEKVEHYQYFINDEDKKLKPL